MEMAEIGCFQCHPCADRPAEAAWDWSAPRALCWSHKVSLKVEDGQLLDSVLDRAAPTDHPLEGSPLAWIFNPVYIEVGADQRTWGWTDFAGGGMAVFEDRFAAQSYFEFRALETPCAVDLLYALRLAGPVGTEVATLQALLRALAPVQAAVPRNLQGRRGPWEGLSDLTMVWNVQLRLGRLRTKVGRLWPESFRKLTSWVKTCGDRVDKIEPSTEVSFFRELGKLAIRRFPAVGEVALNPG